MLTSWFGFSEISITTSKKFKKFEFVCCLIPFGWPPLFSETSKPIIPLVLFVKIFSNLPVNHFSPPCHLPVRPFVGGAVKGKVKAQHRSPRHPNIPHHFSSSYGVYLIKIRSPVFLSVPLAASMRTPSFCASLAPTGTWGISTYSPAVRGVCTCPLEQRWCMEVCSGAAARVSSRPWL